MQQAAYMREVGCLMEEGRCKMWLHALLGVSSHHPGLHGIRQSVTLANSL